MRFIIRADATKEIGTGHVMRTSVIAEELLSRGFEVIFVGTFTEIPWLKEYMKNMGFTKVFQSSRQFLSNPSNDFLILDSYHIPVTDSFIQKNSWNKILAIVDDSTPQYLADTYVHPGLFTSWQKPKRSTAGNLFYGEEFILIRKSLREIRGAKYNAANSRKQILITGGGSDPFQFSQRIVELIATLKFDFNAFIIASSFELPAGDSRFQFIPMGRGYENLLPSLDLAITTAGTSSYEFLYLGIRTALASAVENQVGNQKYLVENSLAFSIGHRNTKQEWELDLREIEKFLNSELFVPEMKEMKESMGIGHLKIVDLITD